MKATTESHCVAVFDRHQDAERAIRALESAGFDLNKLSIIGRDSHNREHVGFYNAGDRVKYWGRHGAFWGALLGIMFAPALFWIPRIGSIPTGGIISSRLMGAVEGGVVGAIVVGGTAALAAALFGLRIPKDTVIQLERELDADKFLLTASGSAVEVERERRLLAEPNGRTPSHLFEHGALP